MLPYYNNDPHFADPHRWGQIYIMDALMTFVPQEGQEAEMIAERIMPQLQHGNSAVILTTIKVLLYLMNYMENRKLIEYICKKMGPPLGNLIHRIFLFITKEFLIFSNHAFLRLRGTICRFTQYTSYNPKTTRCAEERRESILLQV